MELKAQVKMLVQQVVEAYVKEQELVNKKPSIAILLAYQSPNSLKVLDAIKPLLDAYNVIFLIAREWLPVPPLLAGKTYVLLEETDQKQLVSIMEKTTLLVIPAASYSLLSKLALTVDDELPVWLAIQYQLLGKPLVIASNHVEPNVYQQIHAPYSVRERLQSYIRQITADQVNWIPLSRISQTVEQQVATFQEKKSLILEKHIEQASRDGFRKINVPKRSQMTPAAKDLARELDIQIVQSSKGGQP